MPVGDTVSQPYLSSSNHSDLYYGVDVYRRDQKKKKCSVHGEFLKPGPPSCRVDPEPGSLL